MDTGNSDISLFIKNKTIYTQQIIRNTIIAIVRHNTEKLFSNSDTKLAIPILNNLYTDTESILQELPKQTQKKLDVSLDKLQKIVNNLSMIICGFGTRNIEDLLFIIFGSEFKELSFQDEILQAKFDLIKEHITPYGYKVIHWNKKKRGKKSRNGYCEDKIIESIIEIDQSSDIECYELEAENDHLYKKMNGIRIIIQNEKAKKTLIINGIIDNIHVHCFTNKYIQYRIDEISTLCGTRQKHECDILEEIIKTFTLKDVLIHGKNDVLKQMFSIVSEVNTLKQSKLEASFKRFMEMEVYMKCKMIMNLLLSKDPEINYICYLLYELLALDQEDLSVATMLYDILPWKFKTKLDEMIKISAKKSEDITKKYEVNQVSIEQQIYLMKAPENVKEKAMLKLKEIKGRPDEGSLKAKQYIEGLLKLPFGIYRQEPILKKVKEFNKTNNQIVNVLNTHFSELDLKEKPQHTILEIYQNIKQIRKYIIPRTITSITNMLNSGTSKSVSQIAQYINNIMKSNGNKRLPTGQPKQMQVNNIEKMLQSSQEIDVYKIYDKTYEKINDKFSLYETHNELVKLETNVLEVETEMNGVMNIMEKSIYGHSRAKSQIMKIIGQWMNGKLSGYCFGFEGSPGIGKCFKKDTPIMLSNGQIKMVQDITTNDKLMGDDSKPRNVLGLGSGREKMYHIEQVKGDDYIVNESHILSLKMTKSHQKGDKHQTIMGKRYYKNDIIDICIRDYLTLPKYLKDCLKGYKVGLEFEEEEVSLDPYALGYWLGDGDKTTFRITTIEKEVIEYFNKYAKENGLQLTRGKEGTKNEITYHITTGMVGGSNYNRNPFLNSLKKYNLIRNKHIPEQYKINSRQNRLKLLAGLIDSDGYYNRQSNAVEITQKIKPLAKDILFLVRSLGMRGTIKECEKSCMYKGEKKSGIYQRIIITGEGLEEIPVKCPRKKARKHEQRKGCLHTGITVTPLEEDTYYGFQIDGNSRFLLGDFTVTHNTSLAKKGISKCLIDDNDETRPFSFIALGGSANGSTIEGHSYTYMNSTWGKIVEILMDSKCMNPIIYIDELDKVSKTEHGKEIIGILTHMIDSTQNDSFQDKYFSGIDIDLSKALFIFSYNDPEQIDRILLDRIHRIKFDNLTLEDKMVIVRDYILPEINDKMGFDNVVNLDDHLIQYIIENYTLEPGVRKLKEILFDMYGEINLEILKVDTFHNIEIPLKLNETDIDKRYLKNYKKVNEKLIHSSPAKGIINGLWANALGHGGIIPIQCMLFPSSNFLELRLTGLQGDVMKESMNVAKTLAWDLTPEKRIKTLLKQFGETKKQGLHIHCPEGAISKDGPSAGTAITVAIYSIFNNKEIRNDLAITGEINLQGQVTPIGGLDVKIIGGIKAGVKTFLYPNGNQRDFEEWKTNNKKEVDNIKFISVNNIKEVFKYVFVE
jgi:hypothetical protein